MLVKIVGHKILWQLEIQRYNKYIPLKKKKKTRAEGQLSWCASVTPGLKIPWIPHRKPNMVAYLYPQCWRGGDRWITRAYKPAGLAYLSSRVNERLVSKTKVDSS